MGLSGSGHQLNSHETWNFECAPLNAFSFRLDDNLASLALSLSDGHSQPGIRPTGLTSGFRIVSSLTT
jgi:hypothetical protein